MARLRLRAGARRNTLSGTLIIMLVVMVLGTGGLLSHYGWALFYPTNADGSFHTDGPPQHLQPPVLQRLLLRCGLCAWRLFFARDLQNSTSIHKELFMTRLASMTLAKCDKPVVAACITASPCRLSGQKQNLILQQKEEEDVC